VNIFLLNFTFSAEPDESFLLILKETLKKSKSQKAKDGTEK
jgi:hypothetical protein